MEIVVVGRHTEVTDRFRQHAQDKLDKLTQLAPTAQRIDVEVNHENNPRLADVAERVELTVRGKGPVVRAEAAADDRFGALDLAIDKLTERLRRVRDRRKDHRQRMVAPTVDPGLFAEPMEPEKPAPESQVPIVPGDEVETTLGDSPVVVRQKLHTAEPMTRDDALYQMEAVGHDFYLFVDIETARPSVAYRRHGWSYGVIALDTECDCTEGHVKAGAEQRAGVSS